MFKYFVVLVAGFVAIMFAPTPTVSSSQIDSEPLDRIPLSFPMELSVSDPTGDTECASDSCLNATEYVAQIRKPDRGMAPTNRLFTACQSALQAAIRNLPNVSGNCVELPLTEQAIGLTHYVSQEGEIYVEVDPTTEKYGNEPNDYQLTIRHEICHVREVRETGISYGNADTEHSDWHGNCTNGKGVGGNA